MKNKNFSKGDFRTPQRFTIGGRDIQEEKLLSEGGYGYIWKAYDTSTREVFALKKMICQGPERSKLARNEMDILKKLPPSENIMRFYDGQIIQIEDGIIAIFLLEFCSGGSIFDLMVQNEKSGFSESQVINMIKEIAKGLRVMHCLKPPVAHRDIKIENVLINNGRFKLCDFGSCSTENVDFSRISPSEFYSYEEFYERNTTMMYRPPEMSDLYLKFEVTSKVDIWMLGCVLYTICFFKHPFQDSSKLAISTAKYSLPKHCKYSAKLLDFIRHMLTPNPKFRPDVHEVLEITEKYDMMNSIKLNPLALELKMQSINEEAEIQNFEKSIKPLKKFDGDIPMDELLNLKKKIENDDNGRGRPKQKKPVISNQKNYDSGNQNTDWNENPSNKSSNFSGFDNFYNTTQNNNAAFQNFSNFNDWKDDNKKSSNAFSFEKKEVKNEVKQNNFSSFNNNFNFNNQTNNNNNNAWNNNPQNNFVNPQNEFSNFNNNFNFNNSTTKTVPQQTNNNTQDYSQFFNVGSNNFNNNSKNVQPNLNSNNQNNQIFNNQKQNLIRPNNNNSNSPEKNKQSGLPIKNVPSQTMDLIGLEEVQNNLKTTKPINLLEDLGNLNFN